MLFITFCRGKTRCTGLFIRKK